ncbi:hypothetical protein [Bacillus sp. EB600]|uniref:hypothetical protein n=1 Tax=Bacillus sp. EB600 TaxID=2806345 RepID=UPI002109C834|nr:hypothetical protein [Bacillus sp. EB600]MCQ6281264.1 hypothetical protein [Bacillus sp. EB600]
MQNSQGYYESGRFFMNIVSFVLNPIAGLFLYIALFVLTAIGVYYMTKNNRKELICHQYKDNIIYLNSASKEYHKNRRVI